MRKKILTGILAVSMIACMTACGTKDGTSSSKPSTEATTEAAQATTAASNEAATEAVTEATTEATTAAEVTGESANSGAESSADSSAESSDSSNNENSEAAPAESGDSSYYVVCTNVDKKTVEDYAANAKETYLQQNWVGISEMIIYPITLYPDVTVNNADEFLKYMENKAISGDDRAVLEDESCVDLFANSTGICLGSGQIWIGEDFNNPGKLGIIGLSGVVDR